MSKPAIADYWSGAKTETNRWGRLGTNGDNSETLENKKADFRRLFCFCWPWPPRGWFCQIAL